MLEKNPCRLTSWTKDYVGVLARQIDNAGASVATVRVRAPRLLWIIITKRELSNIVQGDIHTK